MFKQTIVCAAVALAALCARADFLYWQVADAGEFTVAELYAKPATGDNVLVASATPLSNDGTPVLTGTDTGLVQSDLQTYGTDAYSFFVELVTYADDDWENETGRSQRQVYSYQDLKDYVHTDMVGKPVPSGVSGLNMGAAGSAVPEPTSGVLLLIGGAMLALRRRRRV